MQSAHTIPSGFPQDTVNINQMEHFSNHFVGSFTSVADNGISVMVFFDAILVHAKACGPNGKQRRNELARDAEGIVVALAKFEETCAELRRVDDGMLYVETTEEGGREEFRLELRNETGGQGRGGKKAAVLVNRFAINGFDLLETATAPE
jgi:hypothetical protein